MKSSAQFESIIKSIEEKSVLLNPPGNRYELRLHLDGPHAGMLGGDRITGTARARALKVHAARGGGAFIEPLEGEPRIVAGRVVGFEADGSVLVRSAIPLLVTVANPADLAKCKLGEFVNFHVESGMTFQPSPEDAS